MGRKYELVCMGVAVGVFCGAHGDTGEGGGCECELESGDGDTHGGDPGFCVDGGIIYEDAAAFDD